MRDQGIETVSLYTNGPFTDLCRGPHTPSTKRVKAFKLLSVAGAYWRGDASRQMLTRVYGTAFHSKDDLEQYLHQLEEARARDHRRLGRDLGLFMFSELSPGSPFWQPPGKAMLNQLQDLWREENADRGYREVQTPILYDVSLWKQSGHWDVYRDNMYFTDVEGHPMGLKPMNCPAHVQLYKDERHSYRDLPIRYSRGRASSTATSRAARCTVCCASATSRRTTPTSSAPRSRCRRRSSAAWTSASRSTTRSGSSPGSSSRPGPRSASAPRRCGTAPRPGSSALVDKGLEFEFNPGDGAFYGPKIDLHMTDSIGRPWQLGTVQLDYYMPERFELTYTGADNADHRPVMIHRALMGSFERFMGILIEHYAGEFPLWLAPVQATVLPLADRHVDYAREVQAALVDGGLRADLDERTESVGRKIREAELRKVPYMLVVGDREAEQRAVALRRHREGDQGTVALDEVVERLAAEAARARADGGAQRDIAPDGMARWAGPPTISAPRQRPARRRPRARAVVPADARAPHGRRDQAMVVGHGGRVRRGRRDRDGGAGRRARPPHGRPRERRARRRDRRRRGGDPGQLPAHRHSSVAFAGTVARVCRDLGDRRQRRADAAEDDPLHDPRAVAAASAVGVAALSAGSS